MYLDFRLSKLELEPRTHALVPCIKILLIVKHLCIKSH